jgi:hypothetical protein
VDGTLIACAATALAVLALAAIIGVVRDAGLTSRQKLLQVVVILALPLLGPVLTWIMRRWTSSVPTLGGSAPQLNADRATGLGAASHEHHPP